jgi:hypothetical protein
MLPPRSLRHRRSLRGAPRSIPISIHCARGSRAGISPLSCTMRRGIEHLPMADGTSSRTQAKRRKRKRPSQGRAPGTVGDESSSIAHPAHPPHASSVAWNPACPGADPLPPGSRALLRKTLLRGRVSGTEVPLRTSLTMTEGPFVH